jgi:hypothetical protein
MYKLNPEVIKIMKFGLYVEHNVLRFLSKDFDALGKQFKGTSLQFIY